MRPYLAWMVLLLLAAAALRFASLPTVPPGLTHDEADHGLSAWGVVQGVRPIYFTVGYGREPLYDYATAGLMTFLGPTYLAGRLTSVYFSLILIAAMAAWTRRAFGSRVALLTAAGLSLGFWPLMAARQGLRSLTQPVMLVLALWSYWAMVLVPWTRGKARPQGVRTWFPFLLLTLFLGLSFYTYIPARIMWLLFPASLLRLWLGRGRLPRWLVGGTVGMLAGAAAIGWPLFHYLQQNPDAETRISQLRGPLTQAFQGEFDPLVSNVVGSLRLFTFTGDSAWRYNIAGQPWLNPIMGTLFYAGLLLLVSSLLKGVSLKKTNHNAHEYTRPRLYLHSLGPFLVLLWLFLGLLPVLITGPELSSTQAIAMQPVLYLFPAFALYCLRQWGPRKWWPLWTGLVILLYAALLVGTVRDYFYTWANHPEVRVQYESNLVETIGYINQSDVMDAAISTTTPGPFHSPAIALLLLTQEQTVLRWFNGTASLLIPQGEEVFVTFSGFAPLHPTLTRYFAAASPPLTLPLRPDDRDRPIIVYKVNGPQIISQWADQFTPAEGTLGDVVRLRGYALHPPRPEPGVTLQVVTWWEILAPTTELIFFTHLAVENAPPAAQDDRLDVPSPTWVAGDMFLQVHTFILPEQYMSYPLVVGAYAAAPPHTRLPVTVQGGGEGDTIPLTFWSELP